MGAANRQVPFLIRKYECLEPLGGNMANIYLARDTRTERQVVLKLLRWEDCANEELRQRFLQEAQLACRCLHPNIVTTFDADEEDGQPYIVMEFVPGDSLRDVMNRGDLTSMSEIVSIAVQVARGLAYVHQMGVIHRDIKPTNVQVMDTGQVKLIDFGIARSENSSLTQAWQRLGTPQYMSPEQLKGESIGPASDIYSFGVMFYEMLAGRKPYKAQTSDELFAAILYTPADPAPLAEKAIPRPVADVVLRCLQKDPAQRPVSFLEVEAILRPFASAGLADDPTISRATTSTGIAGREWTPMPDRTPTPMPAPSPATPTPGAFPAPAPIPPPQPGGGRTNLIAGAGLLFLAVCVALAAILLWPRGLEPEIEARGGPMVLVPEGPARLGANGTPTDVSAFYIDKTEVSNATYLEFCQETGHTEPPGIRAAAPDLPVVSVSYNDAAAFAKWADKRLPTDAEWEKAARGGEGLMFPWGNEWRADAANLPLTSEAAGSTAPMAVTALAAGASPYGALQMLGNVWEWVNHPGRLETAEFDMFVQAHPNIEPPLTREEPAYRIRGGSFQTYLEQAERGRLAYEFAIMPARLSQPDLGFRCARDAVK